MEKKTINISVPKSMADFIEHEVEGGEFASTSDFIRTLVREYQAWSSENWIDALIARRRATAAASDTYLVPQSELECEFLGGQPEGAGK